MLYLPLLSIHLALLMRQSLLLLRPLQDVPGRGCTLMQRIRNHGSGAALAALPLLLLWPLEYFNLPQCKTAAGFGTCLMQLGKDHTAAAVWVILVLVWLFVSLVALLATRLQHYTGLAFSSRNAGPADFGRRWPRWPDGVLWFCELGYLGLVYMALWFSGTASQIWPNTILGLALAYVYYRNAQRLKQSPARTTQFISLEPVNFLGSGGSPVLPKQGLQTYRLRLRCLQKSCIPATQFGSPPHFSENFPRLAMGFCILHFPGLALLRYKQNEHPLSLLSQEQDGDGEILEFALEMQGFLQYLTPAQLQGPLRIWGPYYDVQPDFLQQLPGGNLLYIGYEAGLSPLLHWLQGFQDLSQTPKRLAIWRLTQHPAGSPDFWEQRLLSALARIQQDSSNQISPLVIQVQSIVVPHELLELRELPERAASVPEREIFQEQLDNLLHDLAHSWELSLAELESSCLYRGPCELQHLLQACFG